MQDLKLFVLDLGTMKMDKSLLIEKATLATLDDPHRPAEFIEFPISAYLLTGTEGKVLFDTGCHPSAMGKNGRWPASFQKSFPYFGAPECQLPNRLHQLGVRPDDINCVVLSHMHNDHAGCVEFFSKSKVFVHRDELSAALLSYALHDNESPFIWNDIDTWVKIKLDWYLVDSQEGDLPIQKDVTILNLGAGHSHGMLGLHVRLRKTGGVILASDAIYSAVNFGPPERLPGVVYDTLGWKRTLRRFKWLAQQTDSQVWFGHDANQFAGLTKSTEGFYA
jgi:glyoxylase-like metal-dependent hydrolase (beta-lactamase superfamily II)